GKACRGPSEFCPQDPWTSAEKRRVFNHFQHWVFPYQTRERRSRTTASARLDCRAVRSSLRARQRTSPPSSPGRRENRSSSFASANHSMAVIRLPNFLDDQTGVTSSERVGAALRRRKGEDQMLSMRTVMMTAAVVVAFSAGWLANTS